MNDSLKLWMIIIVLFLVSMWGILLLSIYLGMTSTLFFWGIPIGIILGLGTSIYFADTWDPVELKPKGRQNKVLEFVFVLIIVIGGGLVKAVGGNVLDIAIGVIFSWATVTFGFVVIQLIKNH